MTDSLQKSNNGGLQGSKSGFQFIPESNYEADTSGNNALDPKTIISIILRYKWLVLLFFILGATGAWFYADSLIPTFESRGTLMISSSDASTTDDLSQIISQTTGYGTSSTLANELQVLQSRKFSREIADIMVEGEGGNIDEFPILWKVEESGNINKADKELVAYRIRKRLDFRQPEEESDVVEVSFKSQSPVEAARVVNAVMDFYVKNSTRQNRQAAATTAEFLKDEKERLQKKLADSEEKLRRYMDSTGIVQVNEQASGIVSQRASIESELQNVNLELKTINQAITTNENQLDRIRPGLSKQFSEAIGPRIQNSQNELAQYEREKTLIITKNPGVLDRTPIPQRLKYVTEQIERLKKEIGNLSSKLFTDGNEFMGLDSENRAQMVSDIQNNLVQLRIAKNQNESRRDALMEHKREMDAKFNTLPEGMIQLAKLQRDVRINEELYLNVSRQYADMSVWKQSQFGFGRIIDTGEIPNAPVSPNKKIFLILGLMLGGLFSAGFIAVKEFLDNSVKSVDNLRTIYLPRLSFSVIPSFEKVSKKHKKTFKIGKGLIPPEMVMLQDSSSVASESFRRLKNNIIYKQGDTPPKTIAITSAEKGDGKSTVVANLGIAFAEEMYKTLIIESDFRRPKIQEYFGLSGKPGLSEYLSAKLPLQQIIQDSELNTLKIITAGKGQLRPEIISSSMTFKQLLKKMEEIFDVIILDTPPFGILSDSIALLKRSEVTLVVARYRTTNRAMLIKTIEELSRIQANVGDIVLNDFDYRKEAGSYYGTGYYQTMYSNYNNYVK